MKHDKQKIVTALETRKAFFLQAEEKAEAVQQQRIAQLNREIEKNRTDFLDVYGRLQVQMRKHDKNWKIISDLSRVMYSKSLYQSPEQEVNSGRPGRPKDTRETSEIIQELIDILEASPDETVNSTELNSLGVYSWL